MGAVFEHHLTTSTAKNCAGVLLKIEHFQDPWTHNSRELLDVMEKNPKEE